jgi:uncharacterized membrane protein YhaH (DUF805 family)
MASIGDTPGMGWLFFSPSGRIGRRPFVLGFLFWSVVPAIAIAQMFAHRNEDAALALWTLALVVLALTGLFSVLMLAVKRVHDIGLPGPMALLLFLPIASFFALVAFAVWPSDGPNRFGAVANRPL